MPRRGPAPEKAKDFKGSMKRLIKNLANWKYLMITSLILALISAILALIAPDRLSSFADTISEGLIPNTEKLTQITNEIANNLSSENTQIKMMSIAENIELTDEELQNVNNIITKIQTEDNKMIILSLPKKVLIYLLEDITIDNKLITKEEQYEMLMLTTKMNKEITKSIIICKEKEI